MTIETVYRGHTDQEQYDWARECVDEVMTSLTRGRPMAGPRAALASSPHSGQSLG